MGGASWRQAKQGIVGGGDGLVLGPKKLGVGRAVLLLPMLRTAIFLKSKSELSPHAYILLGMETKSQPRTTKVYMAWPLGPLISAGPKLPSLCSVSITRFASTSGPLHLWLLHLGHSPSHPQGTPTHLSDLSLSTASGRSLLRTPRPGQLLCYIFLYCFPSEPSFWLVITLYINLGVLR